MENQNNFIEKFTSDKKRLGLFIFGVLSIVCSLLYIANVRLSAVPLIFNLFIIIASILNIIYAFDIGEKNKYLYDILFAGIALCLLGCIIRVVQLALHFSIQYFLAYFVFSVAFIMIGVKLTKNKGKENIIIALLAIIAFYDVFEFSISRSIFSITPKLYHIAEAFIFVEYIMIVLMNKGRYEDISSKIGNYKNQIPSSKYCILILIFISVISAGIGTINNWDDVMAIKDNMFNNSQETDPADNADKNDSESDKDINDSESDKDINDDDEDKADSVENADKNVSESDKSLNDNKEDKADSDNKADKGMSKKTITVTELDNLLSALEFKVISTQYIVQDEKYKALYPDMLQAVVENDSQNDIKNASIAFVAWDSNNLPVKIKGSIDYSDGAYISICNFNDINLIPNATYGEDQGAKIDEDLNIATFKAFALSYETFDGKTWENPYEDVIMQMYQDGVKYSDDLSIEVDSDLLEAK